jgi:hypothetical protein
VILPVLVESWQQQCCGTPFAVADPVAWTLRFVPGAGAGSETLEVLVEAGASVVRLGGACLALRDGGRPGTLRGAVLEDHHGDVPEGHPATDGTVRRIRVVNREFVPHTVEPRSWVRADGAPRYRDVRTTPHRYAFVQDGARMNQDTELLVDLEVAD